MKEVAFIGDLFMAPEVFDQALRQARGDSITVHSHAPPGPDAPMAHGQGTRISLGFGNSWARA